MRKIATTAAAAAFGIVLATTAHADGTLNFYNWTNYFPPELLKKFEQETQIKVTLDTYDSNETLLAKLQAGASGYDIVVPSDYMVDVMIKDDMLEPFDAKSLENFKGVSADFADPWFDPGRLHSVPYMWGTTGFTYDSARVPGQKLPESWKSIFEPAPELSGQIAMLNDEVEVFNAAAYYLGVDVCTEDPKDGQKILAALEKQKPLLAMYQSDGAIERMVAGEVIMHHQWNGSAHRTRMQKPSVVYVYPTEGLTMWQDNLVIPKSAANKDNAKIFVNWLLKPENIGAVSNYTGYANAVEASMAMMDPTIVNDPAVNMPAEFKDRLRPAKNCSEKTRELRDKVWTRLKK